MSQGLQASEQESGEGLEMVIGQASGGGREGETISSSQDTLCAWVMGAGCLSGRAGAMEARTGV